MSGVTIFTERDHNPYPIAYPVEIMEIIKGKGWYDDKIFTKVQILSELDPNSPDNHLGRERWVDSEQLYYSLNN